MSAIAMALSSTIPQSLLQSSISLRSNNQRSHNDRIIISISSPSSSLSYYATTKHRKTTTFKSVHCSTTSAFNFNQTTNKATDAENGGLLDCVIVGGGISGLCIAQALSTKYSYLSTNFILTEAKDRVGGNITTVEHDGYIWEEGPNSFQPSDAVLTMAVDSGLKDDLVLGDPNAPRFVLWNGKLRPVPSKLTDLPFFDLMSFPGKIRAGLGALGLRPSPPDREESVEEFVRRNLGDEVFERLIEPFCSGVYAGNPAMLSMKAAFGRVWILEQKGGSIIGGTLKTIQERKSKPKPPRDPRLPKPKGQTVGSFRKGLSMLPAAISARLGSKVKLSWTLSSIAKSHSGEYILTYETPDGLVSVRTKSVVMTVPSYVASSLLHPLSWSQKLAMVCKFNLLDRDCNLQHPFVRSSGEYILTYETPDGLVSVRTKSVVMTVPSYVASSLLHPLSDTAANSLSKFYYPPVAAVSLSYPKEAIRSECLINGELKGFGQLHPRSQGVETLGSIYSSSLFPGRAPPGRTLILNYIGGATNPGIVDKTQGELAETVDKDLRKILINPNAKEPRVLGVKVWPQAIPQFLIGHFDLLDAAKVALADAGLKGIFLGGNYVSGVALGRCIEGAYESAAEVVDFLSQYSDK